MSSGLTGATGSMQVATGDTLFAWVYLDPANPPSEVMVGWNDGTSWEHRAYWGTNSITYGTVGTAGRYYAGALPAAGGWVKLSVPASAVGLEGSAVSGIDLSLFNGRATFDTIGQRPRPANSRDRGTSPRIAKTSSIQLPATVTATALRARRPLLPHLMSSRPRSPLLERR